MVVDFIVIVHRRGIADMWMTVNEEEYETWHRFCRLINEDNKRESKLIIVYDYDLFGDDKDLYDLTLEKVKKEFKEKLEQKEKREIRQLKKA